MVSYVTKRTLAFRRHIEYNESNLRSHIDFVKGRNGWADSVEVGIRNAVKENENKPSVTYHDFAPLLRAIGVRVPTGNVVSTFCKIYGGVFSTIAYREIYKHHPDLFSIGKEIYFLLKDLNILDEQDKFKLGVGRTEPKRSVQFKHFGREVTREIFESDKYIYKVGTYLNIQDLNHREAKLWANWTGTILCPIEFIYPDKNILVFPKVQRVFTPDEYRQGLDNLRNSGWNPDNPYDLKFTEQDFALHEGKLVLLNYWNNKFEEWRVPE